MAAPVDSGRSGFAQTTVSNTHSIVTGTTTAGQLLIVFVRFAAAPGTVTINGDAWTLLASDASDASDDQSMIFYRVANGTDSSSFNTVNAVKSAHIVWRITGAENPTTKAPNASGVVIGTAANINPGAVLSGKDASQESFATLQQAIGLDTARTYAAQSWTQIANGTLTAIQIPMFFAGTPTDGLTLEVRTDNFGVPSNTVLDSVTVASANLTDSSWNTFTLSGAVSLSAGTTYWIVVRRTGAIDSVNYRVWRGETSNVYAGGAGFQSSTGTGSWTPTSGNGDLAFAVYCGVPADYLFLTVIGLDSETATATQPSGYSNLTTQNSGTGGAVATNCMIWGASKAATAVTSDDPGAWTSSAPNAGVTAWTIAIPAPAAAAAPGPIIMPQRRRRLARFTTFR